MGMSVSYQEGSAWRWYSVFLKHEKGPIFMKDHAAKLFKKLKHPLQLKILWFFSDEKNFCQDQMVNSQNNCWFAPSPQNVLIVMKSKQPVHIMVLGVVTSNGDMLPFIFLYCLIHKEAYIKCLKEVILAWIKSMATGRPYIWQQDSATYHTIRRT